MRQSRLMSLVEAIANVAVGYGIAVLTQVLVFPLFGLSATISQNLGIGAIFIIVSLARSYLCGAHSRRYASAVLSWGSAKTESNGTRPQRLP
jgi:hypothetical protein